MNDMKWHSGPPPHVGWWNANSIESIELWRWWDGRYWSAPVRRDESLEAASLAASRRGPGHVSYVKWRYYYPEGARVPRVNPEAA